MSKPFLIIEDNESFVGRVWERPTWDEAVDRAVKIIFDKWPDDFNDNNGISREEMRHSIDTDGNYWLEDGSYGIVLAQTEDD